MQQLNWTKIGFGVKKRKIGLFFVSISQCYSIYEHSSLDFLMLFFFKKYIEFFNPGGNYWTRNINSLSNSPKITYIGY